MAKNAMKLGYELQVERGSVLKPVGIKFWTEPKQYEKMKPAAPFKFFADALVGLSVLRLNSFLKSPLLVPHLNYNVCADAWEQLDPHYQIYFKSRERVEALFKQKAPVKPDWCENFEKSFQACLEEAQKPWGFDLRSFWPMIDAISALEAKIGNPLLYNFSLHFSREFVSTLHTVYSLLFHVRSLIAVDHNAHVADPSHEALKVDSISDYIPKAEYVANDAILYWNFKKLAHPWIAGKNSDVRIEKLFVEPLAKAFNQYSHNACYLIDQLPESFLKALPQSDLEETLYLVQMDWLLGSEAGLIFKIREELYGIQNGYEKIFYREMDGEAYRKATNLSVCCEIDRNNLEKHSAAA